MIKRALILLGGAKKIPEMREDDLVICADSGFIAAVENSIRVDHLVGDMDSLPPHYLKIAHQTGVDIQIHSHEKDLSDGEIALKLALSMGCKHLIVAGGKDGRCDHILSTLFLPFLNDDKVSIEIWIDDELIQIIGSGTKREFPGSWKVVSIIPLSEACIVSTYGLKWPLRSERIDRGSTRGIHNEPTADEFSVECETGSILVALSNKV